MKPIRLEIEGINSYEKKQVIDFEKLISRGIFGIFGKTGSGKSTILDAITLALYGNIARGTKGFINSNVSDALVSFRFELGNGKSRETYEVLRKFKKVISEDKISAKSTSVKLLKINKLSLEKEIEVLADKVTEVNNKIYEILGLTENDFLKSVVLPQGKFSEFLLLNGKSKRDMLERIFGLEEYGTNLAIKLASRKKNVETKIDILKAKIGEFSEVTEEKIKEFSEKSKFLDESLKKFEKNIKIEQELLNEYKEISELNKDREKFEKDLIELNKKSNLVLEYSNKIEESKKISDIIVEINRKKELEKELDTILKEGKILKDEYLKSSDNLKSVSEIFNYYFENRNRIPEIKSSNLIVKNIYEKEKEILNSVFESKNILKSKNFLTDKIKNIKENIKKYDTEFEKYQSLIFENKKIEMENIFSVEYREDIENASFISKELDILLKNTEELNFKLDKINLELKENISVKEDISNELLKLEDDISKKEIEFKDLKNFKIINEIREEILNHKDSECSCPVCGNKILNFNFENINDFDLNDKLLNYNRAIEFLSKNNRELNSELIKIETIIGEKNKNLLEIKENILNTSKEVLTLREKLSIYIEKYGTNDFVSEKNKIQNSDKLLFEIRNKNLNFEKIIEEIKTDKLKNEKILNENLLEFDLLKNRFEENKNKFSKILSEINENLNELDFNSFTKKIGFEKSITNFEIFEDFDENILEKDIEVLKELYIFSNNFCLNIDKNFSENKNKLEETEKTFKEISEKYIEKQGEYKTVKSSLDKQSILTEELIFKRGFNSENEVLKIKLTDDELLRLEEFIETYNNSLTSIKANIVLIENKLNNRILEENQLEIQENKYSTLQKEFEAIKKDFIETNLKLNNMVRDIDKVRIFQKDLDLKNKDLGVINQLEKILKGKKFVEFLSKVYLKNIVFDASTRLDSITNGRYTIEIDSEYSFVVSDNINGGIRRSIDTLSGGEIFLTSLSLALALSTQIQLKGSAPLEFFFLDEGFGTLDRELLEIVIESLEKLHSKNLSVGVISHVEDLKNRIPTKLIVEMDKEKLTSFVNIEYS